jgi:general secretion pathway protein L
MSVLSLYVPELWNLNHAELPWRWCDDSGQQGSTGDGRALPAAREVRVMVPATLALHTVIDLPRRGRWLEGLPYALEDRLLGDPESLHVAAGAALRDGRTPVVAIDREWLQAILLRAAALGVRPQGAYSEAVLAEVGEDEWLVLEAADGSLLLQPDGAVVPLDQTGDGSPPQLLAALLARTVPASRPARLRVCGRDRNSLSAERSAGWSALLALPVIQGAPWRERPPQRLPGTPVNLLQGRFAPVASTGLAERLGAWTPVAALLGACLAVWLLLIMVQTWQWHTEARQLGQRSEAALRQAFPETRTVLDPARQLQQGVEALRARVAGGGPRALPALLARVTGASDGLPTHLQHLQFSTGVLQLDWECPDDACAETLRRRLLSPERRIAASDLQRTGNRLHLQLQELTR